MNMKVNASACTLTLMLLFAMCCQTFAAPEGIDPPTSCCLSYTSKRIPRHYLSKYYETSSKCPQPGVVFVTRKGVLICANPLEKWVQDHMDYLGRK
ncbi:C-C motif chemokine 4 homolog [Paroedura picta]|uniref:C-C motif chemokine 4 homolog n=1 Tax=Paroedura picta TaxID=143630 RepID=UPI004056B091